ncbi:uncharacterized protein LOC131970683 [Centropristis striata]|uniref:uncharacterized protein LOC131970683 n=1 Tax=Centropristis striata TaxID=184440 RepID=UPI0027DECC44|nr:uncharacterized protein LOC131970683 [Centropristis striata]
MPKRPFTRSGKALKEDMLATLPSWKGKTQPTAPDVSIMADDSSNGGDCKNLTETNAIQDDEDDFYISSDTLDADRGDKSHTVVRSPTAAVMSKKAKKREHLLRLKIRKLKKEMASLRQKVAGQANAVVKESSSSAPPSSATSSSSSAESNYSSSSLSSHGDHCQIQEGVEGIQQWKEIARSMCIRWCHRADGSFVFEHVLQKKFLLLLLHSSRNQKPGQRCIMISSVGPLAWIPDYWMFVWWIQHPERSNTWCNRENLREVSG